MPLEPRDNVDDPSETFTYQVGRCVLSFGSIEHMVLLCLHVIPREEMRQHLKGVSLNARLNLLKEILSTRKHPDMIRLGEVVGRVSAFVNDRNFLAHNGVSFNIYTSKNGKLMIEQAIVSNHDRKKFMTLKQVTGVADKVRALEVELESSAMEVLRCFIDENGASVSPLNGLND